ncbi:MAG TPA: nuclear transport factor 2 family protein [Candidatus Binatia bacterium]|nr:nuclear transport factor 2 family protein [Candidatus Binatia bacterium]
MTTRPLAKRLRDAYERFLEGNPEALVAMLADDVVYELSGRHLGGGVLRGKTVVLERIAAAAQWCEPPPKIVVVEVVSAGALVVSLERFVAECRGARVDQHAAVVWRFAPDGRCVEMSTCFEDQEAVDRFWEPFTPDRRGALPRARARAASPRARR